MLASIAVLVFLFAIGALLFGSTRWFTRLLIASLLVVFLAAYLTDGNSDGDPVPQAGDFVYVALGDSYASGEGIGRYLASTNRRTDTDAGSRNLCHRSRSAYPRLVADTIGERGRQVEFRNVTCSGATTDNIDRSGQYGTAAQLGALDASVDLVTVQVGGNDADFARVLDRCVDVPPVRSRGSCADWVTREWPGLLARARAGLDRVLPQIRVAAPGATVVVVGYPILLEQDEVPVGGRKRCASIRAADLPILIQVNTELNATVAQAAAQNGFTFLSAADVFADHGLCGSGEDWINGIRLSAPKPGASLVVESFHPNAAGHAALAGALVGSPAVGERVTLP